MGNDILKYVLTSFLGLLIGFLVRTMADYIKGEKTEREALKCLLRSNIVTQYYIYRELGVIPYFVKESIFQEYEAYKGLKGNGFVPQFIEEIKKWKVEK